MASFFVITKTRHFYIFCVSNFNQHRPFWCLHFNAVNGYGDCFDFIYCFRHNILLSANERK